MADKTKRISINAFEQAVSENYEEFTTIEWRGLSVIIKHNLSLKDMLAFVDAVTKNCFSEENATYMPEIKDFATRSCIIEYYTNISLPSNVEKRYELLYRSSILNDIVQHIDKLQFDAMLEAIEYKTAHLAQANIEAITGQMNELYSLFGNLQKQFEDSFGNIDEGAVAGVINALSNGMDEDKIVRAVLAAKNNKGE